MMTSLSENIQLLEMKLKLSMAVFGVMRQGERKVRMGGTQILAVVRSHLKCWSRSHRPWTHSRATDALSGNCGEDRHDHRG